MQVKFTDAEVWKLCVKLSDKIKRTINGKPGYYDGIVPIPRGGRPVAERLSELLNLPILTHHTKKSLVVDDVIDSGKTIGDYHNCHRAVLLVKNNLTNEVNYYAEKVEGWIVFPWENTDEDMTSLLSRIVQYLGEDVNRDGLKETPKRILASWKHLFSGYNKDPKELLKTFDKDTYDQMVLLKNIEFYSMCEHHMMPFFGSAHIAYIPNDKVIGISKLARLLEVYSRRLQIQERIGEQVTSFLTKELNAKGAGCILEARHLCMTARGVEKQHSVMITSSLKGSMLEDQKTREEFLALCRMK